MPDEPNEPTPEQQDPAPAAPEPAGNTPDVNVTPPAFDLITNSADPPSGSEILTETEND